MQNLNVLSFEDLVEVKELQQIILNRTSSRSTLDLKDHFPLKKMKIDKIEEIFNHFPPEKKFRRIVYELINQNYLVYYLNDLLNASLLIKMGLNKDVVFSSVDNLINTDLTEIVSNKVERKDLPYSFLESLDDSKNTSLVSKQFILLLKEKYTDQRICEFILSVGYSNFTEKEILRASKALSTKFKLNVSDLLPKKPNAIDDIHDALFNHLEYEESKHGLVDYPLNQREDFLKMDGKEIIINGESHFVHIPKTRLELLAYSKYNLFDNCVGKDDFYAKGCVDGRWAIIGVFDSNRKPKYCIQSEKYSFLQAKTASNGKIPNEVFDQLTEQLTLMPQVPTDFIPLKKSFMFGYKYNPETKSLFIMFTPKGNDKPKIYEYLEIENDTYESFSKESRKGDVLNSLIKKHKFRKIP